ncbi:sensor histidine kinase [Marinobacterium weihaiense]|uniref:Histidine kinase domain-containing protein n=1 Tax=Marinobacterium weihaiense TaxID=2851016 RepID=A0ABS6M6Z7_9GAMM|nr:ATP-binding protein [Marinobacterium weihaiense]MBV0932047.1 hypothetical protein [Marinobacterium weihaiense]
MITKPRFKTLSFLLTLVSSLVFLAVFVSTTFFESQSVIRDQAQNYNRALASRYEERLSRYLHEVEEEALAISANNERVTALHAGDQAGFLRSLTRWEDSYENTHYDFIAVSFFGQRQCELSRSYVPELSALSCAELSRGQPVFAAHGWRLVEAKGELLAIYSVPLDLSETGEIFGQLMAGVRLSHNRYLLNRLLIASDNLEALGLFRGQKLLTGMDMDLPASNAAAAANITFSPGLTALGKDVRIGLVSSNHAQQQLREALIETLMYGCLLALVVSLVLSLLLSAAVDRQLQQLIAFTRLANTDRNTRWPQTLIHEFNLIGEEIVSIVNCLKSREDELEALNTRLSSNNEEKRQILQHLLQTQERERLRLSNELHDDMAQLLVAVKMNLQLHREELEQGQPSVHNLEQAIALVNTIYDTVYKRIRMLRPFELNDFGLGVSLTSLPAVPILEQMDYALEFDIHQQRPLQHELMSNLYRIAQEALSNVIKHAEGTYVLIRLVDEQDGVRLVIEDDGRGLESERNTRTGGFGLLGIRERAEHMHASLDITSLQAGGVRIEVFVPAEHAYAGVGSSLSIS